MHLVEARLVDIRDGAILNDVVNALDVLRVNPLDPSIPAGTASTGAGSLRSGQTPTVASDNEARRSHGRCGGARRYVLIRRGDAQQTARSPNGGSETGSPRRSRNVVTGWSRPWPKTGVRQPALSSSRTPLGIAQTRMGPHPSSRLQQPEHKRDPRGWPDFLARLAWRPCSPGPAAYVQLPDSRESPDPAPRLPPARPSERNGTTRECLAWSSSPTGHSVTFFTQLGVLRHVPVGHGPLAAIPFS